MVDNTDYFCLYLVLYYKGAVNINVVFCLALSNSGITVEHFSYNT